MSRVKGIVIGFWIVTALFCLEVGFTAYAEVHLPQVAEAFAHLGFPAYFFWRRLEATPASALTRVVSTPFATETT